MVFWPRAANNLIKQIFFYFFFLFCEWFFCNIYQTFPNISVLLHWKQNVAEIQPESGHPQPSAASTSPGSRRLSWTGKQGPLHLSSYYEDTGVNLTTPEVSGPNQNIHILLSKRVKQPISKCSHVEDNCSGNRQNPQLFFWQSCRGLVP